jgi:hypothetical protein
VWGYDDEVDVGIATEKADLGLGVADAERAVHEELVEVAGAQGSDHLAPDGRSPFTGIKCMPPGWRRDISIFLLQRMRGPCILSRMGPARLWQRRMWNDRL